MFQTTPPGPRFTPNLYSDPQVTVMNEITKSTVSDSSPPKQTVNTIFYSYFMFPSPLFIYIYNFCYLFGLTI